MPKFSPNTFSITRTPSQIGLSVLAIAVKQQHANNTEKTFFVNNAAGLSSLRKR
jgi:hypothetical protein